MIHNFCIQNKNMISTIAYRENSTMEEGEPLTSDKIPELYANGSCKKQVKILYFKNISNLQLGAY